MTGLKKEWNGLTSSGADDFRHELKCVLHEHTAHSLANALDGFMQRDEHVGPSGEYVIRSLYYDDLCEHAFAEKIDGAMLRGKFRIRIYNGGRAPIHLEYKEKVENLTRKTSAGLSEQEALAAMHGEAGIFLDSEDALKRRFGLQLSRSLRPSQLVDYIRRPFVCPLGNVRVTIDRQVRAPLGLDLFGSYPSVPAMEPYQCILEVKYDRFIPLYIQQFLNSQPMAVQSQSKFALCRAAAGSTGVLRPGF